MDTLLWFINDNIFINKVAFLYPSNEILNSNLVFTLFGNLTTESSNILNAFLLTNCPAHKTIILLSIFRIGKFKYVVPESSKLRTFLAPSSMNFI